MPAIQEALVPTPASKAKGKGGGKSKAAGKGRGKSKAATAKPAKQESRSNWTTSKHITYVIDPKIDFVHMFPHVKDQKIVSTRSFTKIFARLPATTAMRTRRPATSVRRWAGLQRPRGIAR